MNVFADTLQRFSSHGLGDYQEQAREMPLYLLDRAFQGNPLVGRHAQRVQRVFDEIAARNLERQLWRDADLYYPIFTLSETADDEERTEQLLRRLEIHVGLRPIAELACLPAATYRLLSLTGRVWRAESGRVTAVEDEMFTRLDGHSSLVYLPRRQLFHDILPPAQYPPAPAAADDDGVLVDRVRTALGLLRDVAPATWLDFDDLISTIVLVPDEPSPPDALTDPRRLRWSFNLRLRYFGGIFLNAHLVDTYGVLEGLLHEYLHQRLWQWWELERPAGVPDRSVMVTSPITGLDRPAYVMVHALLVYVGVHELYGRVTGSGANRELASTDWLRSRVERLRRGIPRLHEVLCEVVEPDTTIRAFLDFLMARFATTGIGQRLSSDGGMAAAAEPHQAGRERLG